MTTAQAFAVIRQYKQLYTALSLSDTLELACDSRYVVITNSRTGAQHIADSHYDNSPADIEAILTAVYSA